jgi:hypothetical protein
LWDCAPPPDGKCFDASLFDDRQGLPPLLVQWDTIAEGKPDDRGFP